MSYIKLIILSFIIFISSCSTQPEKRISNEKTPIIKQGIKSFSKIERDYYKQALTALYDNNLDKAESLLKKFEHNRPDLAGPIANLGLIYYKKSNYKKSEAALKKSLTLNSKLSEAHNLMGMIRVKNGELLQAEKFYLSALKYKDKYANAHYNIALLYDIYLQDIEQAIFHYKQYLKYVKNKDNATKEWLEQLENSLKTE